MFLVQSVVKKNYERERICVSYLQQSNIIIKRIQTNKNCFKAFIFNLQNKIQKNPKTKKPVTLSMEKM